MNDKIIKLIALITRLSKKLSLVCKDLDKVSELLQDPEILPTTQLVVMGVLTDEDYD